MNKLFKYIGFALISGLFFAACSPEKFEGADPNGLPTVEGKQISVTTDQETNTAVFTVSGDFKGCYPVWYLDGAVYSLLTTSSFHSMEQGTHALELRIMNRNGQSQAALNESFTFNETKVDYGPYFDRLCGKTWRVDYAEAGHMGCGESGSDGSTWWSAAVNDKADWGVYDDRISFTHSNTDDVDGGSYSYNPGEGGTVYVNKDCSILGQTPGVSTEDVMVTVSPQESTFKLIPGTYKDEECLYIQFPPQTLLPYIPYDDSYNNPYFRIEALTNTRLTLVCDNGAIAWRLVFTSREDTGLPDDGDDTATMDWNYDAANNLWKAVDEGSAFVGVAPFFADNDWKPIANSEWSHDGDIWNIVIPAGIGSQQWQAQFPISTTLTASMAKKYNFYCVVESDNDIAGVTIKCTESDGPDKIPGTEDLVKHDDNFFFADRHDVVADKPFVYKVSSVTLPKNDAHALSLIFDFGGAPAGTHIKISKIYLEEDIAYDDEANLWKAVDNETALNEVAFFFADNDWQPIANPKYTHDGNTWALEIPEGIGTQQWQGQFLIHTKLAALMTDNYSFYCTVEADNDIAGVTIKCTESDGPDKKPGTEELVKHDDNFFFADRHDIAADKPFVYKVSGATLPKKDAHALSLIFDFGGASAGTKIKISNVILVREN